MKAPPAKTVRFAAVVAACGRPQAVSLWLPAQQDPAFSRAVRQNRVMSLRQETVRAKKDFGMVGFVQEKNVSYLVFPKPLTAFEDRRVVGVRYDLIKTPGPVGAPVKAQKAAHPRRSLQPAEQGRGPESVPASSATKRPPAKRFQVTLRFMAQIETTREVEAETKAAAREEALQNLATPDFSRATVTRKITKVTPS